jgi:hypothetical protein
MGCSCSSGEGDEECIQSFGDTLENVHLEDQDWEGMLILRWILRWWAVRMELAEDHVQSRLLVLAVWSLLFLLLQCYQSVRFLVSSSLTWSVTQSVSQSCSNSWTKALSFHAYTVSRDLYSLMHELARFRYLRPPKVLPVIRMSRMVFTSRQEHIPYVPYHKLNSMKHSWSIEQQQEAGSLVVGPRDEQFISGTGSTNMNKLMRCRFKIETNRKFLK